MKFKKKYKMKKILIITFFLSIGAFAQDSIINYIKNNPIKYFDIKSFEKDNETREDIKLLRCQSIFIYLHSEN